MNTDLTPREEMILNYLRHFINMHGYPPSVREICQATNLKSSSTIHGYLNKLASKGYIRRDSSRSRAIEVLDNKAHAVQPSKRIISVPLLGNIAAGQPLMAIENIEDVFPLPSELTGSENAFMLHVKGNSMIEAGIFDNDYLIVRPQDNAENGDIVVALLDDEATVKYFYREQEHIKLVPANRNMQPIYVQSVKILGKVVSLYRRFS